MIMNTLANTIEPPQMPRFPREPSAVPRYVAVTSASPEGVMEVAAPHRDLHFYVSDTSGEVHY